MDLKFEFLNDNFCAESSGGVETSENIKKRQLAKENNLKLIVEQCIDNFVSVLGINYPFYFEYMLKKCLEFSSKNAAFKYGSRHLKRFSIIFKQNELLTTVRAGQKLDAIWLGRAKFEKTFEFLVEYFGFERSRFRSQKRSFYSHWCVSCGALTDVFSSLFTTYLDRFGVPELATAAEGGNNQFDDDSTRMRVFQKNYDILWEILINLYLVWIEPSAIKEVTSQCLINVKEVYERQMGTGTAPDAAVLLMFDSFLFLFNTLLERLSLLALEQGATNQV